MNSNRYLEEDFNDFLTELLNGKMLNDSKEEGIAKHVISQGFNALSEKQKFIFNRSIEPFIYSKCIKCRKDIPWIEMLAAEENEGKCQRCDKLYSDEYL